MKVKTRNEYLQIFSLNSNKEEFEEIIKFSHISVIFDSEAILLFINHFKKNAWLWIGEDVTTKMKFMGGYKSPAVRDRYGSQYRLKVVDEGDEPESFKDMIGTGIFSIKEEETIKIKKISTLYNKGVHIIDNRSGSIYIPDNEFEEFKKKINNIKIKKSEIF